MNIQNIPFGIRAAVVVAFVFAMTLSIAYAVTEDFNTFNAAMTAASTPLGSGDRIIVLQGGANKYIAGNSVGTLADSQTLTNKIINGASNTLTVLAPTQLSGQVPVANGGVPVTPVSGGIPCGISTTTYAFSVSLTANLPLIGGGAGACPGLGSFSGNTTKSVSTTAAGSTGQGGSWDVSGNWIPNANAVYTNVANSFTAQQQFASTVGTQNPQSGISYTLVATGINSDCGRPVYFTNSSPITVTLPNNAPVSCVVQLMQGGTGQITVVPASGATGPSNPRNYTKTFAQSASIFVQVDTNSGTNAHWVLMGDGA